MVYATWVQAAKHMHLLCQQWARPACGCAPPPPPKHVVEEVEHSRAHSTPWCLHTVPLPHGPPPLGWAGAPAVPRRSLLLVSPLTHDLRPRLPALAVPPAAVQVLHLHEPRDGFMQQFQQLDSLG